MGGKLTLLFFLVLILNIFVGCVTVKPYEKGILSLPVMDMSKGNPFDGEFDGAMMGVNENMSDSPSGTASASCPTCGG